MKKIERVAVIGSGVMGSGIAAHIANANIAVDLLDIVPKGAEDRNILAGSAVQKMLKNKPASFMHKKNAALVTVGNLEDHLDRLKEADWIIEVVLEDLQVKKNLYKQIDSVRKKGAIVSSNTSTIPLQYLTKDMSADFAEHFLITHFFNPPRYMRLLELVVGPQTKPEIVEVIQKFSDVMLGKGVVHCHDTPGFIANRIGTFWMICAVNEALRLNVSVEEADAVMGRPIGVPKTGVFGLLDLVGIDLMPHIGRSMMSVLPEGDAFKEIYQEPVLFNKMIADGYTGRKGKGGFYRLNVAKGQKVKEALNLQTGDYAPAQKPYLPSLKVGAKDIRLLVSAKDKGGQYAKSVLVQLLTYAAQLVPEIADDICGVDAAMRWGYNWKFGPFELIDQLGSQWLVDALKEQNKPIPALLAKLNGGVFYKTIEGTLHYFGTDGSYHPVKRPEGVLLLEDVKRRSKPVLKTPGASLWDIGDGVACFEFTTKMNALDNVVLETLEKSLDLVEKKFKALVIYNEGSHFSAGANLGLALFAANVAMWPAVEELVKKGQDIYKKMKYSPFPVIGAPAGMALGGGCEILLHCNGVQAHAESYIGLVEVGVGLLPAWGGSKEMLDRWAKNPMMPKGPMPAVSKAFENISTAKVSTSAIEAKELLYLSHIDRISMNRDRLLSDAKKFALEMVEGYKPSESPVYSLPGEVGQAALNLAIQNFKNLGMVTPYDEVVAGDVAIVLTGGDTDITESLTEDDILALERKYFIKLMKSPSTLARMEHMLTTGKPLRN